jgi:hypothetical protein
MSIPRPEAMNWHCKYYIKTDKTLLLNSNNNYSSYNSLDIETYGFD